MLRAHLTETKHCYLHPHRVVKTACARCKTPYCDDCLEARDTGLFARIVARDEKNPAPLFCERCVDEVQALEEIEAERRRPIYLRLRPTRAGLRRVAIWAAVLAVIGVPMGFAVRSMAETPISAEELGRIKLGLSGGYLSPEGIDLIGEAFEGRFVRASAPSQPGFEPSRLIDSWASPEVPGWRSAENKLPVDLVFRLERPVRMNTVTLRAHPTEPPETWVRDFELHLSDAPDSGYRRVLASRLAPSAEVKETFGETVGRYIMLRVLSTQGTGAYASLGELEIYSSPPVRG